MSKFWVLGNWKSNGRKADLVPFTKAFNAETTRESDEVTCGIALPFHLVTGAKTVKPMQVGAQNVSMFDEGAYTGEITAGMLEDMDTSFCLVGHSERRQYFGETVSDTEAKLHKLLATTIFPVFCIGETLAQRQGGLLEAVLRDQLSPVAALEAGPLAIAYEPVWAIGTGVAATPADVAQAHGMIRGILDETACANAPILYGGSVKPMNANDLAAIDEVGGFLVGGASLEGASFANILNGFIQGKRL